MEVVTISKSDLIALIREALKEELTMALKRDPEASEEFISSAVVCKLFNPNISRGTLFNYTKQGKINSYLIGSKRLYKKSEVIAAVQHLKRYQH